MVSQLDATKRTEDFIAAVRFLRPHPLTNGKVGVVGFCWGGGMTNTLAVRVPDLDAAVPYYGAQPSAAEVQQIKAPLLIHYAGLDERVNAGWPAYEAAQKAAGKTYTTHIIRRGATRLQQFFCRRSMLHPAIGGTAFLPALPAAYSTLV